MRVLVVDDAQCFLRTMRRVLAAVPSVTVELARSIAEAKQKIERLSFDLLVVDVHLGDGDGLSFLSQLRKSGVTTPAVLTSGFDEAGEREAARELGASFVLKECLTPQFLRSLCARLGSGGAEALFDPPAMAAIVGRSQSMDALRKLLRQVAPTDYTALIEGETGTGKELVSLAIHDLSPRRRGPYVPINCAQVPEGLFESTLFGHERGAFTGALRSPGVFREANGGTACLDEIGELGPALQVKLLRALETGRIRPVGGSEAVVSVRVVCATNRNLRELVRTGHFREDLYQRLSVLKIAVPPLREHASDVRELFAAFAESEGRLLELTPRAARRLEHYAWPGNVRELKNLVRKLVARTPTEVIDVEQIEQFGDLDVDGSAIGRRWPIAEQIMALPTNGISKLLRAECDAVLHAYDVCAGNCSEAARKLDIGRTAYLSKLQKARRLPRYVGRTLPGEDLGSANGARGPQPSKATAREEGSGRNLTTRAACRRTDASKSAPPFLAPPPAAEPAPASAERSRVAHKPEP